MFHRDGLTATTAPTKAPQTLPYEKSARLPARSGVWCLSSGRPYFGGEVVSALRAAHIIEGDAHHFPRRDRVGALGAAGSEITFG